MITPGELRKVKRELERCKRTRLRLAAVGHSDLAERIWRVEKPLAAMIRNMETRDAEVSLQETH